MAWREELLILFNYFMNKSSKRWDAQDDDENRRRKLNYRKKKQRNKERSVNYKNVRSMRDLDEFDDEYQY